MPLLRSLSPYVGTAAAAVIFLSWTISTTLQQRADAIANSARQSMLSVEEDRFQSEAMYQLNSISSDVNNLAGLIHGSQPNKAGDIVNIIAIYHAKADLAAVLRLRDRYSLMKNLAIAIDDNVELNANLNRVADEVESSTSEILKMHEGFSKDIPRAIVLGDDHTRLAETVSRNGETIEAAIAGLQELDKTSSDLIGRTHLALFEKSVLAKEMAAISKAVSYLVFAIGTILALSAKFVEERKKHLAAELSKHEI